MGAHVSAEADGKVDAAHCSVHSCTPSSDRGGSTDALATESESKKNACEMIIRQTRYYNVGFHQKVWWRGSCVSVSRPFPRSSTRSVMAIMGLTIYMAKHMHHYQSASDAR